MFRWSGAQPSGAFLAMLALAACVQQEDDGCQPTTVYHQDVSTGQVMEITLPCGRASSSDPDAKALPGSACDDLDDQLGRVVELASGTSPFVAAFFTESNVIVVAKDRVQLVDRSGRRLALVRWQGVDSEGRLDTAAFDGSILVITAGSELVSYNTGLNEVARSTMRSACTSSVLLSEQRLVCGDAEERERTFYVYDALSGAPLFNTTQAGFAAGPMGRVRGRDAFLTVDPNTGPRSFLMYSVDSVGLVTMTGNSSAANHGTFRISPLYAFPDEPATHLITDAGLQVCLTKEDCNDPTYSLLPEGDIAHLPEGTCFGAMDIDAAGKLHGIAGPIDNALYDTPSCESGCVADRIDVATGATEASMPFTVKGTLETLRADPQGGVLLACGPGHRVMLLPDAP